MGESYHLASGQLNLLHLLRRAYLYPILEEKELYFGQYPILEYILSHPGCTQKEIADQLMVSPASIALSTKRMQKSGVLEKKPNESNLRCKMLYVTEKGERVCEDCRQVIAGLEEQMFCDFTQEELSDFRGYLRRIGMNMLSDEDFLQAHPTLRTYFERIKANQA